VAITAKVSDACAKPAGLRLGACAFSAAGDQSDQGMIHFTINIRKHRFAAGKKNNKSPKQTFSLTL
jgi:hypothetical protein